MSEWAFIVRISEPWQGTGGCLGTLSRVFLGSIRGASHVSDGADDADQALAILAREVDEPNSHAGVRVARQHPDRVHPLDLPGQDEWLGAPGRRELQGDTRANFERLVGTHEDSDLGDVRDVRVEERLLRLAI